MIVNDAGEYESMSEDEFNALNKVATPQEGEAEGNEIYCDGDNNPSLVVTRALTTNVQVEENQRCNLFHTRARIKGKSIKVIIDGGSCHNLASKELCEKLQLKFKKHPHPYHVQRLSDSSTVKNSAYGASVFQDWCL